MRRAPRASRRGFAQALSINGALQSNNTRTMELDLDELGYERGRTRFGTGLLHRPARTRSCRSFQLGANMARELSPPVWQSGQVAENLYTSQCASNPLAGRGQRLRYVIHTANLRSCQSGTSKEKSMKKALIAFAACTISALALSQPMEQRDRGDRQMEHRNMHERRHARVWVPAHRQANGRHVRGHYE
jgi:hypothetical protein